MVDSTKNKSLFATKVFPSKLTNSELKVFLNEMSSREEKKLMSFVLKTKF